MGLYQFRDFLTLLDVMAYLSDKGLVPPVRTEQDYHEVLSLLAELVQADRLTPVFDYDGYIIVIEKSIYEYEVERYKGMVQASYTMIQNWKRKKPMFYKPFKGQFNPFQDTFVNERYRKYVDDGKTIILYANNHDDDITEVKLLYPREQIELVFNQSTKTSHDETTTLQTQLDQAHARIAELESEQGINLTENPWLVLGAIMQTIKQTKKTNYTQASHYQFIIDNYEGMGLSHSNFEKTVSRAKTIFLQKTNKKSK